MLGLMRKHAKSWLIKVTLFAIVIVFIFWGGYSYTERRARRVAVVNGSYIDMREYQDAYNNLLEEARGRFGKQFSPQLVDTLKLKEQALDRLINQRLLLQEARRLKLVVTREELQKAILAYPAFQSNGQFDLWRYRQTLRRLQLTPQQFEASQRRNLLIAKVEHLISRGAKVTEAEALSFFHLARDRLNLAYVQIEPREFAARVKEDKEALRHYFKQHRQAYRLPARRKIVYVRFRVQEFLREVKPSEAEIEQYYRLHQQEYVQPKKIRARHIFFRIPPQVSTARRQAIMKKARKILALARQGKDFATLARKYSDDATASRGGDLGYFSRAEVVKPFADAAFSLKKGEISGLVRTRFGLNIIKVEDIKEAATPPLAQVKKAVLRSLKQERAREIARRRAEAFADQAHALDDLRKAAAAEGLKARESGFFAATEPIPGLGRHRDLNEAFFSLRPKEISPPLSLGEDQLVAQLLAEEESRLPEFAGVREKVRKDWTAARSRVLARKQAEAWLRAARQQGSLLKLAERCGLKIRETGFFSFTSPPALLDNNQELLVTAFALTPQQPIVPKIYKLGGTFFIFQLRSRQPTPEAQFQKEKTLVAGELLRLKKELTFQRWLTAQRQQSDIRILQRL